MEERGSKKRISLPISFDKLRTGIGIEMKNALVGNLNVVQRLPLTRGSEEASDASKNRYCVST
jgi:hypothetical protein